VKGATVRRSTTPILDAIEKTAPRISTRSVPLSGREAVERTLATYPNATPMEVLRAVQHATHTKWIAERQQPLPITRLLDNGCSTLGELLDAARVCPQCSPKNAQALAAATGMVRRSNAPPVQTQPATFNGKTMSQIFTERTAKAVEAAKAAKAAKREAEEAQRAQQQHQQPVEREA
jgi:hypothetical protein